MELIVQIDEPWQKEAVQQVVNRFEGRHPGVLIKVLVMGNGEIRKNLYSGGIKADLVQLFNGDIADCSRDGLLWDLNCWLGVHNDVEALFHPAIFRCVKADGVVGVLPLSATMKGIFYNKQWLERADLASPEENWTWDDFLQIALKMQQAYEGHGEESFAARISFHWEYMGLLLQSAGTNWLSPCKTKASGYTNSQEAIQAISWAVELVNKHRVARPTQEYFTNRDLLRNQAGMMLDYFVMLHEIQPRLNENLGVAGLPRFSHRPKINEPWICGFGISSSCEYPELAWELLLELTATSNALTQLVTEGFIAPLRSVFSDVGHDQDPLRTTILREFEHSAPLPIASGNSPLVQLMEEHVNPALARIVFEGADVKLTMDQLAEDLDKRLHLKGRLVLDV